MSDDVSLAELLDDLRHDLGKYLCLPLRMLPRAADARLVRAALAEALLHTRRSGVDSTPARELYARSRSQLLAAAADPERLRALDEAVATALAWEAALSGKKPLKRARVEADLDGVGVQIEAWLREVERG